MSAACRVAGWVANAGTPWGRQMIADVARVTGVTEAEIWHHAIKNLDELEGAEGCPDLEAHERALMRPPSGTTPTGGGEQERV